MPSPFAALLPLLQAHSLQHLFPVLQDITLDDLQTRLASNRPMLLTYLKELGVIKLGERQALANALAKSEKVGQLPAARTIPHLQPPVFEEDDSSIIIHIKVPPQTAANQLKVSIDVNSLHVELQGQPTAASGKLYAVVKPHDCLWELVSARAHLACLRTAAPPTRPHTTRGARSPARARAPFVLLQERSARPEYDPMSDALSQPAPEADTLVVTLVKAQPARWVTLFTNTTARRYVPPPAPPPPESEDAKMRKRALEVKKRDALHGIGFVPRKLDLGRESKREARTERRARERAADEAATSTPSASAKEHWPSHAAVLLWREGLQRVDGAPDHPEESGPLYTWSESQRTVVVSASTRRGLPQAELTFKPKATSVECRVGGVPTPWCGHLVGKILPAECTFEVVRNPDPSALTDTLQLTLVKADRNRLWRAPWPELVSQIDVRERRSLVPKPRRDVLMVGGYDQVQRDGILELVVPFKVLEGASYLSHDDLRVAVTPDGINVHVAGQEDAPMLSGQLHGTIDVAKSTWRVRNPPSKKKAPVPTQEILIELVKHDGGSKLWRDLFKVAYL